MANQSWYPLVGALAQANERITAYANSVIHLFKSSLVPDPGTLIAAYEAAEADYDSYAPITVTPWVGPILAPGSGYEIISPSALFSVGGTDPVVPNLIGGFWLEDAAGKVRLVGTFDPFLPMQMAGQGIPVNLYDLFPTGYTGV